MAVIRVSVIWAESKINADINKSVIPRQEINSELRFTEKYNNAPILRSNKAISIPFPMEEGPVA